jgi:ferritin-like metal-binding protein YciE
MNAGLHKMFVDELRDAYDAEKQLIKALPKLAKASTSAALRTAFLDHLEETRGHVSRLEQVFASIGERARGKHCDGIAGIIEEGKAIMEEDLDHATLDACLIAAGQRSEHYEMAAYGTLAAWARVMGHREAARVLDGILEEEKAADQNLNTLAEGGINAQAVAPNGDGDQAKSSNGRDGLVTRIARAFGGGRATTSTKRSSRTAKKRSAKKR